TSLAVLRDLDTSLLEHDVLAHLLMLGEGEAARGIDETLDGLRDRMAEWILAREGLPLELSPAGTLVHPHPTLSLRRLRALLHLADGDVGDDESDPPRAARRRKRCMRIARAPLDRVERGPPSAVRRTILAGLARSLDALVRVGVCDVIDAFLAVARHLVDPGELLTLAAAGMSPDPRPRRPRADPGERSAEPQRSASVGARARRQRSPGDDLGPVAPGAGAFGRQRTRGRPVARGGARFAGAPRRRRARAARSRRRALEPAGRVEAADRRDLPRARGSRRGPRRPGPR